MAEVPPAQPVAVPAAKAPKKKAGDKPAGPRLREMIVTFFSNSTARNVSVQALKKWLVAEDFDVDKNRARIRLALNGLVDAGVLVRTTGIGASGSFKMNKDAKKSSSKSASPKAKKEVKKKAAVKQRTPTKAKKPAVKKIKPKASPKKTAAAKKPAAKKLITKKSPKKVTPKAKKVAKISPKKAPKKMVKKAAPKKK